MLRWFGEHWDAPATEDPAARIDTPAGARCTYCDQPIFPGDRGFVMGAMNGDGGYGLAATHRECMLAETTGASAHHLGAPCTCATMTGAERRADALKVWRILATPIEDLIEASSLGTPIARAMRARIAPERARAVVERAEAMRRGAESEDPR